MKTPAEIESELGLPSGTVRLNAVPPVFADTVATTSDGVSVVTECSLWALRCVCTRGGFDTVIDAGIAALAVNQRTAAHAQWNYAGDKLSRSDFLVKQIRGWIGYNQRQMDTLFAAAVAVEALR